MDQFLCRDYGLGDLLWAKVGHHPYWPCMISFDPYEAVYCKTKKGKNGIMRSYHVQYFGKQVQRGWIAFGATFPFKGLENFLKVKEEALSKASSSLQKKLKMKYNVPPAVEKLWMVAVKEAEFALQFNHRYEAFVFKYEKDFNQKEAKAKKGAKRKRIKQNKTELKKMKLAREPSDIIEDLCFFCEKGSVNLRCAGMCDRSFHKECLGLVSPPEGFKCSYCRDEDYMYCFGCKSSTTHVVSCTMCQYQYHDVCLKQFECANIEKAICSRHTCYTCYKENPTICPTKGAVVECFRCPTVFHATDECMPVGCVRLTPNLIVCPDHYLGRNKESPQPTANEDYCAVCGEGGTLICCEACPTSYHLKCIDREHAPAGDYICDDCKKRPYLYVGMIVWVRCFRFRFWPAVVLSLDDIPENIKKLDKYDGEFAVRFFGSDEYAWTHRGRVVPFLEQHKNFKLSTPGPNTGKLEHQFRAGVEEAKIAHDAYLSKRKNHIANSKPPAFKHIRVNHPVFPAVIHYNEDKADVCKCNPVSPNPCSTSACTNRVMQVECDPHTCLAGELCENQRFLRRSYASVKVIKTANRGWGLAAKQFIPKDLFIMEYVGEVITEDEYEKRKSMMIERSAQNYYFMYLDSVRIIDAGPKGNWSRFINHSCDPNCVMQKWSVNGDLRVGIFAITNILPGQELTFNYYSDNVKFGQRCFCGSENCQGYIGRKRKAS